MRCGVLGSLEVRDDGGTLLAVPGAKERRLLAMLVAAPPTAVTVDRLVDHFGSLQRLLAASLEDLMDVDGVGESRARAVREGLSRLAESSILERYV